MITNEKGKDLPFKIKTTREAVNSLDDFHKKLYEYFIEIGDVKIVDKTLDLNSQSQSIPFERVLT